MVRISRDDMFLQIAHTVSFRGTCPRAQVGAVLVNKDGKIRSIGYNGAPKDKEHCEDVGCLMEDDHCVRTIHAEVNALDHLHMLDDLPHNYGATEYTLYTTHKPCDPCTEEILRLKKYIKRVVFDISYRYDGPPQWEQEGIIFEQYNPVHSRQ